jgi:hypothetical protein
MNLNQLFETAGETVAIIFGRFNPPHKGHRAAWEMASKYPVWYVGTNQSTQGPKDPLPYDVKVEAMKTIWPEVEGHIVADTSWLTLASNAFEAHPNASTLLCLTDEDWVTKTIQQYNGKQGAHGFYNFKEIKQQPTPRLSSATALRNAVVADDRDAFSQAAGVSADTTVDGKSFFDLVADYLLPYANAPKKAAKPKAAPVEEPVAEAYDADPAELKRMYHYYVNVKGIDPKEAERLVYTRDEPVAEGTEMSDAAQARELIGRALRNQNERQKYFDFIKYLIGKHGKDYGTTVHQLATKLAKEGQDGMAGVGMGNYVVDKSTSNESRGHKVIATKLANMDRIKNVQIPTPQERNDELEKQKKEKEIKDVDETAAWQKKAGKNKKGGLNAKGVASYRREHPGSKLQTAVTKKPSELKPGSKDAKRRKSFCARMGGSKGPMKKPNGDPTRKALALRKWHCESIEDMAQMIENAERFLAEAKVEEKWTQKYKSSINCSHPKGFSQKAHCAGKKKHNESAEMEMTCPDCGMCQTHGNISEVKQRLDAKCWKGYKKQGTKIKGDTRVNNCVPVDESIEASMAAAIKLLESK